MGTENKTAGKIPSILALLFVTLHVSAFVAVTVLQFRHVRELERNLSARRSDIADLTVSCGAGRHSRHSLNIVKRSLDELASKNVNFEATWKLVKSRQTSSVSSLMSGVLHAQEQQLIQKCSGDVKICLSGVAGGLGVKGDKGLNGSKGDTGAPGIDGLQGLVGSKGASGTRGTAGTKGVSGVKGQVGPRGVKGETGSNGSKGPLGPIGAQGSPGGIGDVGQSGEKGSTGQKGSPGLKGQQGTNGTQGPSGVKGEAGDPGPQGLSPLHTGPVCGCIEAPYISSSQESISSTLGSSLNLTCLSDGSPPSTVTWYKINEPGCKVNGTSGNVLTIPNLEPSDIGQYICVASNSHGTASKNVDVTTTDTMDVMDCNFESHTICHWTQSSDNNISMVVHSGLTVNPATGPVADHTLGTASGQYLYLETAVTSANQNSRIESMTVPANKEQCFTAWYNMFGVDIGSLQIYKKGCDGQPEQMLWSEAGSQGQGWHKVSVSLPAEPGSGLKLIIQTTLGSHLEDDIAIDDLSLTDGSCVNPLPVIAGPPIISLNTTLGNQEALNCNASGIPDPSIAWSKPTSCRRVTDVGSSHSIAAITFADGGKYTCTATNALGNATKDFILKINGSMVCDLEQRDYCGWTSETAGHPDTWLFHSGNTASSGTGPTNDHTKGTSNGEYLYMEASAKDANDTVVLVSPTLPAMNDVCLKFWYNMNGAEIGSLNIYTKDCHGVKTNILSYVGAKGDHWLQSCSKVVPQSYEYNLLIEGVVGTGYRGDIAIDDIELSTGGNCRCPTSAFDSSCDFENDLCTWTQDSTDDFNWAIKSGPTDSIDTGPTVDHTTGSGQYVYVEASSPQKTGHKARLLSPVLTAGQSYCLDYWYHMYGNNMGTLNIYTQNSNSHAHLHTLATLSQNKGNNWLHSRLTVPVQTVPFELALEAVIGSDYASDIALDDVKLSSGAC